MKRFIWEDDPPHFIEDSIGQALTCALEIYLTCALYHTGALSEGRRWKELQPPKQSNEWGRAATGSDGVGEKAKGDSTTGQSNGWIGGKGGNRL